MRVKIKALKWAAVQYGKASIEDTERWEEVALKNAAFRKQLSEHRHSYVQYPR